MMHRCIIFFLLLGSTVGCESLLGDFTITPPAGDSGPVASEAGAESDAAAGAGSSATVRAITSDVSVYLGQSASVDASMSTTTQGSLAYAWRVKSTPNGSRVMTTSLTGATSAAVSFVPDLVGRYVLEVTVRGPGASDTHASTVTVAQPQVLFVKGVLGSPQPDRDGGGQGSVSYAIADFDGGNAHPVLCADMVSSVSNQGSLAPFAAYGGRAYDYWEAPPGMPSKFAAFTLDNDPDAGLSSHLWAGTSASTCSSPAADLGSVAFGPGRPFGSEPHFNSDGTRFVVFDRQWQIVTYSADGSGSPHAVATYPVKPADARSILDPVGVAAGGGYVVEPPRVAWTATGLAWAEPTAIGWEIVTAPDQSNATPTTYMTCQGVIPREIAMLSDGTIIASFRQTRQASENLYRLKPDAQQNCSFEQQYTNLSEARSSTATDFAVSPDERQIAFLQIDPATQDASPWMQGSSQLPGGYLYVVPVAGGTPTQLSSAPFIYGPRWIGGATALVLTRLDGYFSSTGGLATSVLVVAPDGGGVQVVAQGDGVATFVSTSGNAGCSAAGASAPGAGGAAPWFMVLLAGLRRCRSDAEGKIDR
jgi:hypothetical protein